MGCCSSREAAGDIPYRSSNVEHVGAPDSSSRNITAASPRGSSNSERHVSSAVAPNKPNKRLKPMDPNRRVELPQTLASPVASPRNASSAQHTTHISPLSDSITATWTRKRLEKERNDWWDTRVTGNPDIWRAYRMMVDHLQRGDVQSAQALLDATGCTCPSGELWRTIYDESGIKYATRNDPWIVFEPMGLVEEQDGGAEAEGDGQDEANQGQDKEIESGGVTTQEKGKGKVRELFKVKCRLSSTGRDIVIEVHTGEKISSLIQKIQEAAGLQDKRIRINYLGHQYQDNDTLTGWTPGHVMTAFIFDTDDGT